MNYRVESHDAPQQPLPTFDAIPLTGADLEYYNLGRLGGAGCFVFLVLLVGAAYVTGSFWAGAVLGGGGTAAISMWIRSKAVAKAERAKAAQEKRRVADANEAAVSRARYEATSLSTDLVSTLRSSEALNRDLARSLVQASSHLQRARHEYQSTAFGPFWDAVEQAALELDAFNQKASTLARNAEEYHAKLNGRRHTFPQFPAFTSVIPDGSRVAGEFRQVVRLGQTNFQFANIWEHRRTREVLIAGFRTLGEAVNNLGGAVESSIYRLQRSVSSDLAQLVSEQIRTREAIDRHMRETQEKQRPQ